MTLLTVRALLTTARLVFTDIGRALASGFSGPRMERGARLVTAPAFAVPTLVGALLLLLQSYPVESHGDLHARRTNECSAASVLEQTGSRLGI